MPRELDKKRFNPDYKPPRDKFGILLSIEEPTEKVRKIWEYPIESQDHICSIFGYCPIHRCVHDHPSRAKKKLDKKGRQTEL